VIYLIISESEDKCLTRNIEGNNYMIVGQQPLAIDGVSLIELKIV